MPPDLPNSSRKSFIMAKPTATITDNETGKSYEMPIIHGSIGPRLVDIRKFYGESGMFTYDPGFTSTGSCGSKITYIDGDEGILLYRGYNIAELAVTKVRKGYPGRRGSVKVSYDFRRSCFVEAEPRSPNVAAG